MFRIDYETNGIVRNPIFSQDIKDVGQILINIANDEKTENEAMQWCGNANFGDKFVNKKYKFSIQCVFDTKHVLTPNNTNKKHNKYITSNKEIISKLKNAIDYAKLHNMQQPYHLRIYDDGCWYIDLERLIYGTIRIWVGYEDKRSGRCNCSLCTVYDDERYAAEFNLKEPVKKKILSIWKELKNQGIL